VQSRRSIPVFFLQLLVQFLELHDVVGRSLQEGDFAALLIGHREDILQTGIAVSKFIAPSLFCLDALTASGLLPSICDTLGDVHTHVLV